MIRQAAYPAVISLFSSCSLAANSGTIETKQVGCRIAYDATDEWSHTTESGSNNLTG